MFVADLNNFGGTTIYRFDSTGNPLTSIVGDPTGKYGMAFGPNGNLFATNFAENINIGNTNGVVMEYDKPSDYANSTLYANENAVLGAAGIAFDAGGDLFVAGLFGQSVVRYDASGNLIGTFANVAYPADLLFAPDGDLWATSLGNNNPSDPIYGQFLFPGAVYKLDVQTGLPTPFATLGENFQPTALLLSPVPEPSSLLLLAVGAGMMMRMFRRKRR
jgi:sugar lactone lactonase YvrE